MKQEDTSITPKKLLVSRPEPEESSPRSTPSRCGRRVRDAQEGGDSPARKKVNIPHSVVACVFLDRIYPSTFFIGCMIPSVPVCSDN